MNRQDERNALSTRRLLEAAGQLLVEGGYANMTLAAVGERAGYSRGLANSRFGTKINLVRVLIHRIVDEWGDHYVVPRRAGSCGLEAILAPIDAIREQMERGPSEVRVLYALFFDALGPVQELRDYFAEFHSNSRQRIVEDLKLGIQDGSVRNDIDVQQEAVHIVACMRGIAYQWALDPDKVDPVSAMSYLRNDLEGRLKAQ